MLFLVIKGDLNEEAFGFWFKSVFNYSEKNTKYSWSQQGDPENSDLYPWVLVRNGSGLCPLDPGKDKIQKSFDRHIYSLKNEAGIVDTFLLRSLKAVGTADGPSQAKLEHNSLSWVEPDPHGVKWFLVFWGYVWQVDKIIIYDVYTTKLHWSTSQSFCIGTTVTLWPIWHM